MNDIEKGDITFYDGKYRVVQRSYASLFSQITYNSKTGSIILSSSSKQGEKVIFQSNMEKKINE